MTAQNMTNRDAIRRVVLIGFSATGKSTIASALAARLGWDAIDTDSLIEGTTGRTVPNIFAHDGEPAFRALERKAARAAAGHPNAVIATGGGLWLDPDNRHLLSDGGFVVALEARWDTILARHVLAESARPMLGGPLSISNDPVDTVRRLKAIRQPYYALADATVHTDIAPVADVVDQIVAALDRDADRALASGARHHALVEGPPAGGATPDFTIPANAVPSIATAAVVRAPGGAYPVYCAWGLIDHLPAILDRVAGPGRLFVITDQAVHDLYATPIAETLRAASRDVVTTTVPSGETSKSTGQLLRLYDWLSAQRAERGDTVVAVGGGVVTDLAGTAAATYLRGMNLVHVPTTLLGMVDASVGGKVAIDLPAGKNLVGAFYQPRAVIADIATLATLPPRELRAGFAEVIKHALIRDPAMLDELERDADSLLAFDAPRDRMVSLIGRNMAIKACVVSADERESDLRMTLNYGHTIGHAIEAVTQYGAYLHGEAVAIGLIGAAAISRRVGLIDAATEDRHRTIIQRFGLPTAANPAHALDPAAILDAMRSDKKISAGRQRWVLLESIGSPVVRDDVPGDVVEDVVRALVASPAEA
jgi:shikimate kinase/3-dehydroquinate synthase